MNVSYVKRYELSNIADIWFKSFKYNFYSIIGRNIVLEYLKIAFGDNKKYFFKITYNNKISGFIVYGNDFIINQKLFKIFFLSIIGAIIKNIFFLKFFRVIYIFQILFYLQNKNNFKHISKNSLELITICVDKKRGLGTTLLRYSIQQVLKNPSVNKIYVKTAYPSKKTYRFYKKNGFKFYKITFNSKWQILSFIK